MPTIIAIIFIACCFLAWFYKEKSKVDERKLLIEMGFDPFQLPDRRTFNFEFPWLKVGCTITGGSIGLLIGVILLENNLFRSGGEPILGVLIFGGIGMIIAHYVDKPGEKA